MKKSNMVKGDKFRITVLTERLIRLEYQEEGLFEDRYTFKVVNRDFPKCSFINTDSEKGLTIETSYLKLSYDKEAFSTVGLTIELKESGNVWHYGMGYANGDRNLRGTARTLDGADGPIDLEGGIFGRNGYAVMDDSEAYVFEDVNGTTEISTKKTKGIDIYFFGYGEDYYGGLKDFYRLSGKTPMIPRYALGNWWSRYYRYTEESYNEVLNKFEQEEIPLSVAVIDMDWHLTDIDPKYGTGWTGYTWNKELFPDPARFLGGLHDRGLHTTLNLHPADGIRAFEDMYENVAKRLDLDTEKEEGSGFDFGDPKFRQVYFEEVMNPYEKMGVDFWWIDWQQGTGDGPDAVDPLFLLNHYHYKDQEGRNVRPMIFSRYAGPGSHRYPVGFSGDTKMTWRSLEFQPFFTSNASNIGYGFWSHDIGGHMLGEKDLERLTRWIQFGVFSPIMRLHSSSSAFLNKEPWVIDEPYRRVMGNFMRLRHAMIPYMYSEIYKGHKEDRPLIRPMYYGIVGEDMKDGEKAYSVPHEYYFGDLMAVGAITEPENKELRLAPVNMIVPDGRWYDLLTGRIYKGGFTRKLYRTINEIPVLLRAGSIIPMNRSDKKNGVENPDSMKLCIGAGKNGEYELYEDDGISMDFEKGAYATTKYKVFYYEHDEKKNDGQCNSDKMTVSICSAEGDLSLIPEKRDYELCIYGVEPCCGTEDVIRINTNINNASELKGIYDSEKKTLTVEVKGVASEDGVEIAVSNIALAKNDKHKQVFDILERAWIETVTKDIIYSALKAKSDDEFLKWLSEFDTSEVMKDAIREVYMD
ncbi:TIM-barrel domain-containing protein [Butyrivibrio sp. JL13D10]|uniref:glycoside hydrolase family 31 protein n=1 Tax=Butyrivibrio sp. JL13D10 TaxID=3236815 RepID=UPI0038B49EBB